MRINDSTRLSFRLMGQENAQALWALDQDPEVMRFLTGGKLHNMDDITNVVMPRMAKYTNPNKGWGIWQVSDKSNKVYLGWILARPMGYFTESPKFDDLEIGWRFFKKAWGKGYATEAAITIKDAIVHQALIDETNINFISASTMAENISSIKVMEKLGMRLLRKYRHVDPISDVDAVHYQMVVNN